MLRALALVLVAFSTGCAASTAAPPRTVEHVVVVHHPAPAYAPVEPSVPPRHARARPHHKHQACNHPDHADHADARKPKARGKRPQPRRDAHVHRDWEQAKKKRPSEKSQDEKDKGRTRPAPSAASSSASGA